MVKFVHLLWRHFFQQATKDAYAMHLFNSFTHLLPIVTSGPDINGIGSIVRQNCPMINEYWVGDDKW